MSETKDTSVEQLSESFKSKASIKRSPTFSSKDFDNEKEEITDLASLIQQRVDAEQDKSTVKTANGKRIRHSSIDESKKEDENNTTKWQEQVAKKSRIK